MPITSTLSDISRLRAENHTLRNHCVMWQRCAEIQRSANLDLIKLANTIRDQASHLARERDELQRHCSWLKNKLDDDALSRFLFLFLKLIGPYQIVNTRRRHILH